MGGGYTEFRKQHDCRKRHPDCGLWLPGATAVRSSFEGRRVNDLHDYACWQRHGAGNGTSLTSRTSPLTVGTLNINGGGTIDSAVGSEGTSGSDCDQPRDNHRDTSF